MLQPTGPRRQSETQPSEFEAALRKNEPVLSAANVAVRTPAAAVSFTGKPEVPEADPDRELIWTVGGSSGRFNLAELLAKPEVAPNTPLNAKNSIVRSVGSKLCMLARSTDSPSQFLFSADQAGAYAVAITVSSIDLEPWARRSNTAKEGLRDAIGESLAAGAGVNVTDDPDGRTRVAVTNPRPPAGADLSAAGKFAQPAPDSVGEWRLKAIQKIDPRVVRLEYNTSEQKYQGTFPISADGAVTARLEYVRVSTSGSPYAGKFLVTTYPYDASRTPANLFDQGTVDALILQGGSSVEEAMNERTKLTSEIVKDTGTTNTLALVTKTACDDDPSPLGNAATAYVRVNFRLTGGVVTGWNRDSSKDINEVDLGRIKPGALAVVQNGMILVGSTRLGKAFAFDSDRERVPGADISGIGIDPVHGMAYNRNSNKLAIIEGGYREPIKVLKLTKPGTAEQGHEVVAGDEIAASKLARGRLGSLWCLAWHSDDLWVIDRFGRARVFRNGHAVKEVVLPGSESVLAATCIGDVLLYGGGGDAVHAYNVVIDERMPELELTGSQVTAGLSGFRVLTCMAYDPVAGILYLGGLGFYVAAFMASKAVTAFPEEPYGNRTMSKTRLQTEALDAPAGDQERAFKVVVSEQQPNGASEPRTLTNTQLKQALAHPAAQAGNTERWPLDKLPIVKMTQAQYNADVAANKIADGQNILYVIVG